MTTQQWTRFAKAIFAAFFIVMIALTHYKQDLRDLRCSFDMGYGLGTKVC